MYLREFILVQFASQEPTQLYVMSGILVALNTLREQFLHKLLVLLPYRLETIAMLQRLRILKTNTSLKRKHASTFMSEAKTGPQLFIQ